MERTFDYQLCTDSGASDVLEQSFLIPIETIIWHSYGLYKVTQYIDKNGEDTKIMANIHMVICEKVYGTKNS